MSTQTPAQTSTQHGVTNPLRRPPAAISRGFNRLAMLLAGTRFLPLYGIIEHRGRRSGKAYRTPVVVKSVPGGFVVPMPWGEGTDWFRNVQVAGGCTIRWRGRVFQAAQPEVIDADASGAFRGFQAQMMRRLGITRVAKLSSQRVT